MTKLPTPEIPDPEGELYMHPLLLEQTPAGEPGISASERTMPFTALLAYTTGQGLYVESSEAPLPWQDVVEQRREQVRVHGVKFVIEQLMDKLTPQSKETADPADQS